MTAVLPVRPAPRTGRTPRVSPALLLAPPLLLILACALPRLAGTAWPLAAYGLLALGLSATLLVIAYGRYRDPAAPPGAAPPAAAPRVAVRAAPGLPARPPLPLSSLPRVTFLVAVKDERDGIEACVRSMVASDYPRLNVVVVDDASTDGTAAVLSRLAAELPVRVVSLPRNVGKKRALVRGARYADGEVLAFTDSDCVLAPDALRRCVTALVRHPHLGAVSGHARARNADVSALTRIQDVWYEGQFRIAKAAEAAVGAVTCVSGPLAVFRRDAVHHRLDDWAEDRFCGAEFRFATDRQLTGHVLAGGWHTGYVASARVWTDVPARLRPFLRQQVRWKKSFVRNLFFTGRFLWRRGPLPALLYYGHALLVLAAPLLAAWHLLWAPVNGWWTPTALYLAGVVLKGAFWGLAFRLDHPGDPRWRCRPLMSLLSAGLLSWLLPYAVLTLRRGVWARGGVS